MSDITTTEGRAELRELRTSGTPGEWVALGNSIGAEVDGCTCVGGTYYGGHEQYCGLEGPVVLQADEGDAKLIAAAVNALPALLDALDKATEQRDLAKGVATWEHGTSIARLARAEAAEAALDRVRELHQPAPNSCSALYPEPLCRGCGADYPCGTVRALDGAQ